MDNINQMKRYIFKKDYQDKAGIIHKGSQIDYIRGRYYYNNGMCDNYSNGLFNYIVNTPSLCKEYLQQVTIPVNKL